ncbi:MAG: fibronectin type III domain-containing protein [Minisyncoccia bacterium]|jgi:titin
MTRATYLFLIVALLGSVGLQYAKADLPTYGPYGINAVAVSASEIDLTWNAVDATPGVTGYRIEREFPVGSGFSTIVANTNSASPSYADTNLSPNTTYSYRITAINSDGLGLPSANPVIATTLVASPYVPPPDPPQGLTAVPTSGSQLNLSWTAPPASQNTAAYKIDRAVGGGFGTLVASTTATSYTDTNLSPGGQYAYRVYAMNAAGTGSPSVIVYATMPVPPSPPGNPTAVAGDGKATVSWLPAYAPSAYALPGGVAGYIVTGPGSSSVSVPSGTLSTTVTGLTNGVSYSFYVSAQNVAGQSSAVQTNSVVPATSTPQAVVSTSSASSTSPALPANHSSLPAFYFSFALQQGSRGQAVTALQNRLTGAGFYSGPITGYFGLLTKAGVEAYQRAHHVSAIGVVGPLTRAYLNANL